MSRIFPIVMADATEKTQAPAMAAPSPQQVERAIRMSYAQVLLIAVFGASTGGMFLIGFAMRWFRCSSPSTSASSAPMQSRPNWRFI